MWVFCLQLDTRTGNTETGILNTARSKVECILDNFESIVWPESELSIVKQ